MNSLIQLKTLGSRGRNPARSLPLRRGFLLIHLILVCFAFAPQMRAASCHQVINGGGNLAPPPKGGYCNFTTAEGTGALFHLNDGLGNTALGWSSLSSNTDGSFNTAVGAGTLLFNVGNQSTFEGVQNTAVGAAALLFNTTGSFNAAFGANALGSSTGSLNTALGINAGLNLTTGDNNIYIGNLGVDGESNTIRIGGDTGAGSQTATFIAGISGTAVVGDPVVVDANGQLGTATSSARFKTDIKPMDKTSEAILALKPVSFQYKSDSNGMPQFGLIAEEVAKVNPDLVVRDRKGEIYSVRYEAVNAMLLNEFLKEHRKVEQLEKQIEALTAGLQRVSAQLEVSKLAPQTVLNNQ
jgi:trimeric autotransporter adhesin